MSWNSWSIFSYFFLRGQWVKLAQTTQGMRSHGAISLKTAVRFGTRSLLPRWLLRRLIPAKNLAGLYGRLIGPQWMDRHNLENRIFDSIYCRPSDPMQEHSELFEYCDLGPLNAAVPAVTQVEVRDPNMDKRVYDFCFSIPPEQFVVGGHTRSLVRRAMKGRLPEATLLRYTRGQQGSDWYLPMAESLPKLRNEMQLLSQSPAASEALDLPAMQTLIDTWPQSGFHTNQVSLPWHSWLTRAISMGYFLRSQESAATLPTEPSAAVAAPLD